MTPEPAELFGYTLAVILSALLALCIIAGLLLALGWLVSRAFMLRDAGRVRRAVNRMRLAQIEAANRKAEEAPHE